MIAQAQRILRKKELQNSRRNANAVGVSDRATVTVNELKKLFPALGKQLIQSKLVTECGCENIKASCQQPSNSGTHCSAPMTEHSTSFGQRKQKQLIASYLQFTCC